VIGAGVLRRVRVRFSAAAGTPRARFAVGALAEEDVETLKKLLEGIAEFHAEHRATLPWLPEEVAKGQAPSAVMLTCADSRVVPHLVMKAGVGDVFMLRNAGNLVPSPSTGSSEEASIAYAIDVLRVPALIVCGHTHCGAIAALSQDPAGLDPSLTRWLENADVRAAREDTMLARIHANVIGQIERLKRLPAVARALAAGTLKIHGWCYDIETGRVSALEPSSGEFLPLAIPGQGPTEKRRAEERLASGD
jgi:carbonic anhydrase